MINKSPQLIIFGGGTSIERGIEMGLLDRIKDKFVIGCNFSFKFFDVTFTAFADPSSFYERYLKDLKSLPLIIGKRNDKTLKLKLPNTILLKESKLYNRDLSNGMYCASLTGTTALALGIYLLDVGTIFLLGMDCSGKPPKKDEETTIMRNKVIALQDITNKPISSYVKNSLIIKKEQKKFLVRSHWYQEKFTHKGSGKVSFYYGKDKIERYFGVFKDENKIKIYNVSPFSRIPEDIFKKISYDEMFKLLDNETYDQNRLREQIKLRLSQIK